MTEYMERYEAMRFDTEAIEKLIETYPDIYTAIREKTEANGWVIDDDDIKEVVEDMINTTPSIEHNHIDLDMVAWWDVVHHFNNPTEKDKKLYARQRMNEISNIREFMCDNPISTIIGTPLLICMLCSVVFGYVSSLMIVSAFIITFFVVMWSDKTSVLKGMDERIHQKDTPESDADACAWCGDPITTPYQVDNGPVYCSIECIRNRDTTIVGDEKQ